MGPGGQPVQQRTLAVATASAAFAANNVRSRRLPSLIPQKPRSPVSMPGAGAVKEIPGTAQYVGCIVDGQDAHDIID